MEPELTNIIANCNTLDTKITTLQTQVGTDAITISSQDTTIANQAATIISQTAQIVSLTQQLQLPPQIMQLGHGRNTTSSAAFPQGCDSVRVWDSGARWALLEPSRGSYNWTRLDAIMNECEAHGVSILYCFGSTPSWTAQSAVSSALGAYDSTSNHPPVLQDWVDFVKAIVAHVKRSDGTFRIKKWEMWNETNNPPFWTGTLTQLLAMARVLYQIVKTADPTAIVTMPTPCWASTTTYAALDTYFNMGFQAFADVITFHGYLGDSTPATSVGPIIDQIRSVMAKYGVTKPLWDTESGWKANSLIADSAKVQWLTDWVNIRKSKKLDAAYWYQWDNQTNGTLYKTATGITPAGTAWVNIYQNKT